jgi:hypothetical protein
MLAAAIRASFGQVPSSSVPHVRREATRNHPAYPIWALLIIAGNVAALYGLCVYGGRQEVAAY